MNFSRRYFGLIVAILLLVTALNGPLLNIQAQSAVVQTAQQSAADFLTEARRDPALLRAFMQRLPKGGELHSHLSGTTTAERLLQLAINSKKYRYYVRVPKASFALDDPTAYAVVATALDRPAPTPTADEQLIDVKEFVRTDSEQARTRLESFHRAQTIPVSINKPLDIFYGASFQRRTNVVNSEEMVPLLVADAMRQAHKDHLNYLELQVSPFPFDTLADASVNGRLINITTGREFLRTLIDTVKATNREFSAQSQLTVKFIYSFSRTSAKIFSYLPLAFELASANDELAAYIAGINVVGNEYSQDTRIGQAITGPENLRDYILTLHRVYPRVRISLHAGEGTQWDWHIRDSLLMGAERIGHATNLSLSPDGAEYDLMKRQHVMIEACLTSNYLLLGVPLKDHPFIKYLRAGIPVSLNTDDAGIFDTTMTEEFARAAENHPTLTWADLKQIARTSLEYAFVPAKEQEQLITAWEEEMKAFEAPKHWRTWLNSK